MTGWLLSIGEGRKSVCQSEAAAQDPIFSGLSEIPEGLKKIMFGKEPGNGTDTVHIIV